MPLNETGKRVRKEMQERYGGKEEGDRVFFSTENKKKKFREAMTNKDESQGGGFSSKKAEAEWWVERLEKLPIISVKARVLQRLRLKDPELDFWIQRVQAVKKAEKKSQSGAPYPLPVNAMGVKGEDKDKKEKKSCD